MPRARWLFGLAVPPASEPKTKDSMPPRAATEVLPRMITLREIEELILPQYYRKIPCRRTLLTWLKAARIPKTKANPTAKFGGGITYYHTLAVERWLRQRAGI